MPAKKNVGGKGKIHEIKKQNKVLRKIFVGFGFVLLALLLGYILFYNNNHFSYQGVKFETVKFCDTKPCLVVYKTSLPATIDGQRNIYSFYLRTKNIR